MSDDDLGWPSEVVHSLAAVEIRLPSAERGRFASLGCLKSSCYVVDQRFFGRFVRGCRLVGADEV